MKSLSLSTLVARVLTPELSAEFAKQVFEEQPVMTAGPSCFGLATRSILKTGCWSGSGSTPVMIPTVGAYCSTPQRLDDRPAWCGPDPTDGLLPRNAGGLRPQRKSKQEPEDAPDSDRIVEPQSRQSE